MLNCETNKESQHLNYWDGNNLYLCAMSQKLPAADFEWVKKVIKIAI